MAQNTHLEVDFSSGIKGLNKLQGEALEVAKQSLGDVGEEALRLSLEEVPHDKGSLQLTGAVDRSELSMPNPSVIVGYNKVYAARLHEHPEYNFQKGRKGKYLEDPLKNNLRKFTQYIAEALKRAL